MSGNEKSAEACRSAEKKVLGVVGDVERRKVRSFPHGTAQVPSTVDELVSRLVCSGYLQVK